MANKLVTAWGLIFLALLPFVGVVLPVWLLSLLLGG
jgi:hypothetical protein